MGKLFFNNHPFLANVFQSSFSKNKTKQYFIYLFILKSKKIFLIQKNKAQTFETKKSLPSIEYSNTSLWSNICYSASITLPFIILK